MHVDASTVRRERSSSHQALCTASVKRESKHKRFTYDASASSGDYSDPSFL